MLVPDVISVSVVGSCAAPAVDDEPELLVDSGWAAVSATVALPAPSKALTAASASAIA